MTRHYKPPVNQITEQDVKEAKALLQRSSWKLPPIMVENDLETYYLLQWDYEYLLTQINLGLHESGSTVLSHNGKLYYIQLHDCSLLDIRKKKLWLSFRKMKCYSMGYVLIRPVQDSVFSKEELENDK